MSHYAKTRRLSDGAHETLTKMARSRKLAAAKVKRTKTVLLPAQGKSRKEISAKLGVFQHTAGRWISRFKHFGLAGLEEGPRRGHPQVYSTKDVGAVIQIAFTGPRDLGLLTNRRDYR